MLESGEVKSLRVIAQLEGVDSSYVSRMVNLTTLVPDIVAAMLDEVLPLEIILFDLAVDPPALWEEQRYLSTDNDPLFRFHRWFANLRILDIEEIKTVPFVPCSHPFVERAIRTVREELLDQVLFWNQLDLERKLSQFLLYYNGYRVHGGIEGVTPEERGSGSRRSSLPLNKFCWTSHCHGLFKTPVAA